MQISDGERLLAVMLADLMKGMRVKASIDPDLVVNCLASGQMWALRWGHDALFDTEEDDNAVVNETAQILTMCRAVEASIEVLAAMEIELIPEGDRRVFVGFDGNNEPHYGVAKTMIEKLGLWEEFKDRPLNSHCPVLDKYRRQLAAYATLDLKAGNKLTVFQISQVVTA